MKFSDFLLFEDDLIKLSYPDFKVEFNDNLYHSLKKRIKFRTNLTKDQLQTKLQNGVNKMMKSIENNTLKTDKDICIKYSISFFKVIFRVYLNSKTIKLKTILTDKMEDFDSYRMILDEFYFNLDNNYYMITIDE